jgi:hypothetical protein
MVDRATAFRGHPNLVGSQASRRRAARKFARKISYMNNPAAKPIVIKKSVAGLVMIYLVGFLAGLLLAAAAAYLYATEPAMAFGTRRGISHRDYRGISPGGTL